MATSLAYGLSSCPRENNKLKKTVAFLLLTLFLGTKLLGVHAFTHSDDNEGHEHCELCPDVALNNLTPVVFLDFQESPTLVPIVPIQNKAYSTYNFQPVFGSFCKLPFSRPPPGV